VERIGVERIGFGSDFDGPKVPREIGDASGSRRLLAAPRERGYHEAAPKRRFGKLAYENRGQVLHATWRSEAGVITRGNVKAWAQPGARRMGPGSERSGPKSRWAGRA
jgi:hypothetical protein